MTLFDHLINITEDKRLWSDLTSEEQKTANIFMIRRFVSMDMEYVRFSNYCQMALHSSYEDSYNFFVRVLPRKKTFFSYLKKAKGSDIHPDLLESVKRLMEVGEDEAEENIQTLVVTGQIDEFIKEAGFEDKLKEWKKTL